MKGENYRELSAYFQETKARSNTIKALHDVLPLVMYIFYPVQLIVLAVNDGMTSEKFLRFALIPLVTLIVISIIRAIVNAKRPYEVYDYTPPVRTDAKGKSFPSRHTVCAFIIAMAFLYLQTRIGVIMLIVAAAIGVTRVLAGVHFIRDVVSGAAIGVLIGILGYFVF
ncbi:MAG: phosphatase PAP2 family protein [Ruminococcus sp.]|jgi:membrane-associated phospholipid phosphatase|nr:phosphatase PAP2 family protein [Ruminococcus sp.]